MSYTALYRKYRPNKFESVVGQDTTVSILRNSILNNHISHAYLFTGPRGTGKTSIAKIFAHAVNCEDFKGDICFNCATCKSLETNDSDIIEIDAASNNGVEEIRTLRDNVKLLPSVCKYKIYIIDEVHMLSTGAFNALLKTLEEPPSHVIFILATTEPNKIPVTILSRCQRFDFNKIDLLSLEGRLNYILSEENRILSEDVVKYISKVSDGGLRDAINLLDQALSLAVNEVTVDDIESLSGKISSKLVFDILNNVIASNYMNLLTIISDISLKGKSYTDLVNNMLIIIRDYVINQNVSSYFDSEYSEKLKNLGLDDVNIVEISKLLNELLFELKNSNDQKIIFEIYMMNLSQVINKNLKEERNCTQEKVISQVVNIDQSINSHQEEPKKEIIHQDNEEKEELLTLEEVKVESSDGLEPQEEHNGQPNSVDLSELKKIRINNVLAGANKEILNKINKDYDRINDYISNKTYNIIAALLIDGKVVVASDSYLLFTFKDESYISLFDSNYKHIELFMNEIYDMSLKVVAITELEWEKHRQEFILNKKNNISYVLIPENDVKLEVSESSNELEDSAMNIFGEDTISVR